MESSTSQSREEDQKNTGPKKNMNGDSSPTSTMINKPAPFTESDIIRATQLPKEKENCSRYAPMSILMFVLISLYTTFLLGYLPGYVRDSKTLTVPGFTKNVDPYGVVVNNIGHHRMVTLLLSGFYVMVLVNFCLCHFTRSGDVPDTWPWVTDDWLKKNPNSPACFIEKSGKNRGKTPNRGYERKRSGKERKCRICLKYKPDRSHHCRMCETCVLEMDHHCPWIRNCVGYANHKYFFLLLFYGACALIMFAVVMMSRFLQATRSIFTWIDIVIILMWLMDIMLAVVITGFFMFHCYLLSGAYTTIEFCEKLRTKDKKKTHTNKDGEEIHTSKLYATSPYNRSLYSNLCHLLGKSLDGCVVSCSVHH